MLWELEQTEVRLHEIEQQLKYLGRDLTISAKERRQKQTSLQQESGVLARRRDYLVSRIGEDRALSKERDAQLTAAAEARRNAPRPEAERGIPDTPGRPPGPAPDHRALYAAYAKQWHERSVADRANASAKHLERERDAEWEP